MENSATQTSAPETSASAGRAGGQHLAIARSTNAEPAPNGLRVVEATPQPSPAAAAGGQLELLRFEPMPHLDRRTREVGRRGVAEARRVLREAARRAATREAAAGERRPRRAA